MARKVRFKADPTSFNFGANLRPKKAKAKGKKARGRTGKGRSFGS